MTIAEAPVAVRVRELDFFYGTHQALFANSIDIRANQVTAFIGPSGCGKSTHLRSYNRIFELYPSHQARGSILFRERNLLERSIDLLELRRQIGMVFQKPSPLPLSIFENVAYALRLHYRLNRAELAGRVERALRDASLWDEVKDKLRKPGSALSGGQQQRLCIARTIAVEPEVLLMDEPCASLDPLSTEKIEDLIRGLKERFTVVIVTHNLPQARRLSDVTAFMYAGKLVEVNTTAEIFDNPREELTQRYVAGRVG
jgi:phosphate transport system ATP-binding protein